jgi:hypothetical protein
LGSRISLSAKLAAGLLLAITLLAAACSGGGSDKETRTQQVKAGLGNLASYKCTIKISGSGGPLSDLDALFSPPTGTATPERSQQGLGFDATVIYVKPDKSQVTIRLGNDSFSQTTVGKQQWAMLGGLTVGPNSVGTQSPSDLSLCTAFWDDGFADAATSFQCTGKTEKVNGLPTLKCSIDKAAFDQIKQALGGVLGDTESGIRDLSRFVMDIWVTDGSGKIPGGLPVRFQADMAGKDTSNKDFALKINMDLSNINDSKLSVSAPK